MFKISKEQVRDKMALVSQPKNLKLNKGFLIFSGKDAETIQVGLVVLE